MKSLLTLLLCTFSTLLIAQHPSENKLEPRQGSEVTAGQLIEIIIKNTGATTIPNTVDIIKEGDPDTPVKGIVTCMFATMEVLKKAVENNCNLIIVHEPIYYNHLDNTEHLINSSVFLEKKQYINDHNLVIWRFHDYIHSIRPDAILSGMVEKLGWENYVVNNQLTNFTFPEITLNGLLENLKNTFPENVFYVVGNPAMKVKNVHFAPGAPGGTYHIQLLEKEDVDVVVAGEVSQWESYEYVRDAVDQGRNKAIIFIGHISSEESGMEYCAEWLGTFIHDIPITFIEDGSSFWTF